MKTLLPLLSAALLAGCGADDAGRADAKPLTPEEQARALSPEARQKAQSMGDAMRKAHDAGR